MNCKETARLLSESRDRPLSLWERIALRFHTAMCGVCNDYGHQLASLSKICEEAGERTSDCCQSKLPEDCKKRIRDAMKE
jgi:hypothetical protein